MKYDGILRVLQDGMKQRTFGSLDILANAAGYLIYEAVVCTKQININFSKDSPKAGLSFER